jgi:phosphonate transport system ATP-binding protein
MDLLLELNRQRGITLVISLHNVALARRYCERAIALRNGVVVFDGSTNALSPTFLKNLYGTDAEELLAEDELGGRSSFGDNVIPVPYPMSVAAAA